MHTPATILIIFILTFHQIVAQNKVDSLLKISKTQDNIRKIDALNELAQTYYKINPDTSLFFSKKSLSIAKKLNYKQGISDSYYWQAKVYRKKEDYRKAITFSFNSIKIRSILKDTVGLAKAYSNAGLAYYDINKYDSALICQEKALEQYLLTDKKKSTAIAYNNIGSANINLGNYKEAIIAFKKGMELFEEIDYQKGTASCLLNIGQIYDRMGNAKDTVQNNKAIEYFNKALEIFIKNNDKFKTGNTYNSLGIQYDQKAAIYGEFIKHDTSEKELINQIQSKYYDTALNYYLKGYDIFEQINYTLGKAQITNNIGTIYMNQHNFRKALSYINTALKTNIQIDNKQGIAKNHLTIAICNRKMQRYEAAIKSLDKGMEKTMEIKIPYLFQLYYEEYANVNDSIKNYKEAYKYHKLFTAYKDSLLRADNLTTINEVQALYENKIKEKQLLLTEAQVREQTAIAKKRKIQSYGAAGIAFLLLIIAGFIFRNLKQKKKRNIELAEKNNLITLQKQEITDSITYASRIQIAVLPPLKLVEELFKEQFILFKPQHIVSGDFFWIKKFNNDKIIAAAADCTGHGVPGAFMSMLGISFLNEIVSKPEIQSASGILNELRQHVIDSLHQTGKEGEQKDGMDISLIIWHKKENYIEFAGANNPLYLVRDKELIEYKGDKMPIGIHVRNEGFSHHKIEIKENDCIYMFSDGFADQFGGPKGKKFKYKPFKQLLLNNATKSMTEQKQILDNTIEKWKSYINPENNQPYQQIDDIIVLGIRL